MSRFGRGYDPHPRPCHTDDNERWSSRGKATKSLAVEKGRSRLEVPAPLVMRTLTPSPEALRCGTRPTGDCCRHPAPSKFSLPTLSRQHPTNIQFDRTESNMFDN